MMLYTFAKYGLSERYTNRCVLHHCRFLVLNKSWKDIPYVRVSGHKSERLLSNLMRGNCPLLQNMLFPTHLAEQPKFWRQTMLLSQRKQQKTTTLLIQKYFHPNTSQAESSNFKSFQFRHCQ